MVYWYEHCIDVTDRQGRMVTDRWISNETGFRSVYGFTKEAADEISASGHSRGFSKYPVYSDTLLIDIDSLDEGVLSKITTGLKAQGLSYRVYFSGSKGYHLEIDIEPMFGTGVAFSQKQFVANLKIPNSDLSLYRNNSLYRLEGTVHAKTGKLKSLIEDRTSEVLLSIPYVEPSLDITLDFEELDDNKLRLSLLWYCSLWGNIPAGNRHSTYWALSRDFCRSGVSRDTAEELLCLLNQSLTEPKEEAEVIRAVKGGYLD